MKNTQDQIVFQYLERVSHYIFTSIPSSVDPLENGWMSYSTFIGLTLSCKLGGAGEELKDFSAPSRLHAGSLE